MGRQFGWEASKIPRQVDFMLGMDTFFPFESFFVLFFLFFHAEEFWDRGLMWAP